MVRAGSLKEATSIAPSCREEISLEALDCALTANGLRPAETFVDRGGRNRTVTTPSLSGKSESVLGSATDQSDGSPLIWICY